MEEAQIQQKTPYHIPKDHELRLEVEAGKTCNITLVKGSAEVFGAELAVGQVVTITAQKIAVFTWEGADVILDGEPDVVYEAEETPMASFVNVHSRLHNRRQTALASSSEGPRCIVVGPTDAGKSSLCKILVNYAVRMGSVPTLVDLDIGQGSITVPGTIGATPVEAPIDCEEGLVVEAPLAYFYGHLTPSDNPELYKFLLDRLASVLTRRAASNAKVRADGMIINTMGWVEGLGYELLLHAIQALGADLVLVVGQEKLYSQLAAELRAGPTSAGSSSRQVEVVKVAKSGGVVTRNPALRKQMRTAKVEEYFYGVRRELSPASTTLPISDLQVFRVGGGPRAPSSALPLGAVSVADPLRLAPVPVNNELANTLLAVSHAASPDQALSLNVAGFVLVTKVDVSRGTVTFLAPCPGALPGKYLLAGSFKVYLD